MLFLSGGAADKRFPAAAGENAKEDAMTLGTILIILVIIYLLGGWSGRIGGVVLVVLLVLLLLGKL